MGSSAYADPLSRLRGGRTGGRAGGRAGGGAVGRKNKVGKSGAGASAFGRREFTLILPPSLPLSLPLSLPPSLPSIQEFRVRCEEPNVPCVLEDVMTEWPALRGGGERDGLLHRVEEEGMAGKEGGREGGREGG